MKASDHFLNGGKPLDLTIENFWQYHYANMYNQHEYIAEFLVGTALGETTPNNDYWRLWDVDYHFGDKTYRIEVKATSYYHSFQDELYQGRTSEVRTFDIHKAYKEYQNNSSELRRNSDIYVFCLNVGRTAEESNPIDVSNWEFYLVTRENLESQLADENQKSISLSRVRALAGEKCSYLEIKSKVDSLIPTIKEKR